MPLASKSFSTPTNSRRSTARALRKNTLAGSAVLCAGFAHTAASSAVDNASLTGCEGSRTPKC
eukprot:10064-Lingulodinium_polyedra.AAC.1